MPRIAYVNGRYVAHREASVHIEDRGYQFADGVYEVVPVFNGRLVDEEPHLDRLDYSLGELKIARPCSRAALQFICRELLRRNDLRRGILYMQVTRGVAPRDHRFPGAAKSAIVVTTKNYGGPTARMIEDGARVITIPDIRWGAAISSRVPAAQRARQAAGVEQGASRPDGGPTQCHRRHLDQFLDRHDKRDHTPAQPAISPASPAHPCSSSSQRQLQAGGAALHLAEAKAAAEAFSPAARRWCCR
jgi:D-alanine transaminase